MVHVIGRVLTLFISIHYHYYDLHSSITIITYSNVIRLFCAANNRKHKPNPNPNPNPNPSRWLYTFFRWKIPLVTLIETSLSNHQSSIIVVLSKSTLSFINHHHHYHVSIKKTIININTIIKYCNIRCSINIIIIINNNWMWW